MRFSVVACWLIAAPVVMASAASDAAGQPRAASTQTTALSTSPAQLDWSEERFARVQVAIDEQRAAGLMTAAHEQRKRAMLEARRAGTFTPAVPAREDTGELNFIQNGGFEEINRNSARNRSRWLWWNGWSWGGDYENFWAVPPNVHSGQYAAGIRCTGKPGRIGIMTAKIPILPEASEYELSVWAKGEGDNQLFVSFEGGCKGMLKKRMPAEWTLVTVRGKPQPNASEFHVYLYSTGAGTLYLDDAKLTPVGGRP